MSTGFDQLQKLGVVELLPRGLLPTDRVLIEDSLTDALYYTTPNILANAGTQFSAVDSVGAPTFQSISFAGAASSIANSWLYGKIFAFGIGQGDVDGFLAVNRLHVQETIGRADGSVDAFTVIHRTGGGASQGLRQTIRANLNVTGLVAPVTGGGLAFVAFQGDAWVFANQGGDGVFTTDPTTGYKGGLFGGNMHAIVSGTTTFFHFLAGLEVNVEVETGGSVFAKVGLIVARGANDAHQAVSALDAAIAVANKTPGVIPWKMGLAFGAPWGDFGFDATSTLIGTIRHLYPSDAGALGNLANYGVDFRDVLFSSAAFASPGWLVGPTGFMELTEQTAPAAPAADKVRIYTQDNGSGKTQLMARFSSGAAQQIALQP